MITTTSDQYTFMFCIITNNVCVNNKLSVLSIDSTTLWLYHSLFCF